VSGIEGATASLQSLKASKPVSALVEGMAASAAYWLVSQADEIVMTELSQVGSIGVYSQHVNISAALEKAGVDVTIFAAGKYKAEGHPFGPLSDEAKASWVARVEDLRQSFAEVVGKGRGARLSAADAMSTEAAMFPGISRNKTRQTAIARGLADRIGTLSDAMTFSRAPSGRSTSPYKGVKMDENTGAPAADAGISKADHTAAVTAARAEGFAAGRAEALADVAAITGSDEAKGREKQALKMAIKGVSPDMAKDLLADAPKASSLAERMAADPVPPVGAEAAKAEKSNGLHVAVTRQIESQSR
jgi:ClpP class serine protease